MTLQTASRRVLVCGTNYGDDYLKTLTLTRDTGFTLAAILARGSARSVAAAAHYGVPLFRSVDELPKDIDLACVAVGEEAGGQLCCSLLERGIHVMGEHPVTPAQLQRNLETATASGAVYHLSTHWGDLAPAQKLIELCLNTRSRDGSQPLSLIGVSSPRLLYSFIDLMARAVGGPTPYEVVSISPYTGPVAGVPFRMVTGLLGGVPLHLLVQWFIGKEDDGTDSTLGQRLTALYSNGNLTLTAPFGPIIWNLDGKMVTPDDAVPMTTYVLPDGPQSFIPQRIAANLMAMRRLMTNAESGKRPPEQEVAHLLGVSEFNALLEDRLGRCPEETIRTSDMWMP